MKRILIIKQDTPLKRSLSETMTAAGYRVESAMDGEVGIRMIGEKNFDLIICDIDMQGVCGFGLLSYTKYLSETYPVPFIFLTAASDNENRRRALRMGADDYLVKPVESTELLRIVNDKLTGPAIRRCDEQEKDTYVSELETLIHLMSHALRGPICTNLGLVSLLDERRNYALDNDEFRMIIRGIKDTTEELDQRTRELTLRMQSLLESREQYLEIYRARRLCPRLKPLPKK